MNYRDITQLNDIIVKNIHKIPFDIDLVVGIPRSGIIPANMIALYRNVPFVTLTEYEKGICFSGGERLNNSNIKSIKKVLIIDDSLCSGNALTLCKEKIKYLSYEVEYLYGVIFVIPENVDKVDIYFETLSIPRVFQWNIMHHSIISHSCVDIDGVLCLDPTEKENDDGILYENFILNAQPLFLPTVKIHTLVSCRLERYRNLTEIWLKKHNIEYENLILLDLPNKEARLKWGKYGEYKADAYSKSDCSLFVESSLCQANKIAKITNKPVFCIENFQLIYKHRIRTKIKNIIRKILQEIGLYEKTVKLWTMINKEY